MKQQAANIARELALSGVREIEGTSIAPLWIPAHETRVNLDV